MSVSLWRFDYKAYAIGESKKIMIATYQHISLTTLREIQKNLIVWVTANYRESLHALDYLTIR